MTKDWYLQERKEIYDAKVSYTLKDGNAVIGTLDLTFDGANTIKNMMGFAIEGLEADGFSGIAESYRRIRKQLWEQDEANGYEELWHKLNSLLEREAKDDEAQDK